MELFAFRYVKHLHRVPSYIVPFFLQALYFCVPFREQLLEYYANNKSLADTEENLLTCLADLFSQVQHYPRLMDSYFST